MRKGIICIDVCNILVHMRRHLHDILCKLEDAFLKEEDQRFLLFHVLATQYSSTRMFVAVMMYVLSLGDNLCKVSTRY